MQKEFLRSSINFSFNGIDNPESPSKTKLLEKSRRSHLASCDNQRAMLKSMNLESIKKESPRVLTDLKGGEN